ncbi:ABC transporter ATP-binding protein [Flavihumibacter sp. UBA7668]|uniref:ABC transporter ATP-binding protein n=1 Tax=Flavihumibacter sp. UBA7668 TaxID=1946542 RepID=UPI0025B82A12|nr:ABC transporter ATP-binding protein [Flavihumibacter sp. UBA7668]
MTISLSDTGKRYNREWIFRGLSYEFIKGKTYAITGPNGSGKSTLLQVLAGAVAHSEGNINWSNSMGDISPELVYKQLALAAPYLDLIEEMTALEFLQFHQSFKPFLPGLSIDSMLERVGLQQAIQKQIRFYSSGMKQRVKLIQAIFSDTPLLLLDEPCSNLDAAGIRLYQSLMEEFRMDRLVIVSSNDPQEYPFCEEKINILDWKPAARK